MYVWHDYDTYNRSDDHLPVVGAFQLIPAPALSQAKRTGVKYDRRAAVDPVKPVKRKHFEYLLGLIPCVHFSVEPSSHYHILEEHVRTAAELAFPIVRNDSECLEPRSSRFFNEGS